MDRYPISLTADEFANTQQALEHFADYLGDHGRRDYGDELVEVAKSVQCALDAFDDAGLRHFGARQSQVNL